MNRVDTLRNSIIDKLLTISNKDYLTALYKLVENSSVDNNIVKLTEEQTLMLQLSDRDIKTNNLISQDQLDKNDLHISVRPVPGHLIAPAAAARPVASCVLVSFTA